MLRQPWRRVAQGPNAETIWFTGRAGASVRASTWRNTTRSFVLPSCSGPLSSSNPAGNDNHIPAHSGASEGFLHCPEAYDCVIRLRPPEKRDMIMWEFAEAQEGFTGID